MIQPHNIIKQSQKSLIPKSGRNILPKNPIPTMPRHIIIKQKITHRIIPTKQRPRLMIYTITIFRQMRTRIISNFIFTTTITRINANRFKSIIHRRFGLQFIKLIFAIEPNPFFHKQHILTAISCMFTVTSTIK